MKLESSVSRRSKVNVVSLGWADCRWPPPAVAASRLGVPPMKVVVSMCSRLIGEKKLLSAGSFPSQEARLGQAVGLGSAQTGLSAANKDGGWEKNPSPKVMK